MQETSNCDMEKSWKRLLYVSTIFLGLGLGFSYKYTRLRPRDLELNNILFAMKALSIGTFICIGTFGLGIAAISKALKVKNFEEFSTVIRSYMRTSFPSLKVSSKKISHDNTDEHIFKDLS